MSKKFLGTMIAGAALGGASLLAGAPGIALADDGPNHHSDKGHVFTHPKWVKPGHEVAIFEICGDPQEHPWVWSEVTGKLKLKQHERKHDSKDEDWKDRDKDKDEWKDRDRKDDGDKKDEDRKDEDRKDEDRKDEDRKDEDRKDEAKKDEDWKDEDRKDHDHDRDRDDRKRDHFVYQTSVRISQDAEPGRYKLEGSCGDGTLVIVPDGWVDGGDGGASTNAGFVAGGTGMIGAAALGGIVFDAAASDRWNARLRR